MNRLMDNRASSSSPHSVSRRSFLEAVGAASLALLDAPPALANAGSLDFFPILPWDPLHGWKSPHRNPTNGLASMAECNFTMAGYVTPEDLPLCEKLGLAAIMAPAATGVPWAGPWEELSGIEIERHVKAQIEKAGPSKAVFGYFLRDEPFVRHFPALAKAVAAVKKYAPGKLAYVNLHPNSPSALPKLGTASYAEYLERFVSEVKPQFLSYDDYHVQHSDDLQEHAGQQTKYFYENLLEVRRVAEKHGLPFWNIVSSNQIRKFTTVPSPANLALQAYTALAAGSRGLSWFTYYSYGARSYKYAPINDAGQKTETWRYLQVINRQVRTLGPIMNRLTSTGVFFTSSPPVQSLPLLPGKVTKRVLSTASPRGFSKIAPPMMIGEFSGSDGADHVMVVNLSLERSANIKLETIKSYQAKQVYSAEDGTLAPLDEQDGHWLVAGQGVLMKLYDER